MCCIFFSVRAIYVIVWHLCCMLFYVCLCSFFLFILFVFSLMLFYVVLCYFKDGRPVTRYLLNKKQKVASKDWRFQTLKDRRYLEILGAKTSVLGGGHCSSTCGLIWVYWDRTTVFIRASDAVQISTATDRDREKCE